MTSVAVERAALHPVPRWGAAWREQLAVTGMAMWPLAIALVLATMLLMNMQVSQARALLGDSEAFYGGSVIGDVHANTAVYPSGLAVLLAVAALFVPRAAWRGEAPSRRAYHASMPLPAASHVLLKVACGWIWVMLGVAFVQVAIYATVQVVRAMLQDLPDVLIAYPGVEGGAWRWAVPFVATTIGYVIGSAVALVTTRPAIVLVAALIALSLADWGLTAMSITRKPLLFSVSESRLGINAAINGARQERREVRIPANIEAWVGPGRAGWPRTITTTVQTPDLDRWLVAAGTWLLVGVGGLTLASRRRD